jgi:hypothetical protein
MLDGVIVSGIVRDAIADRLLELSPGTGGISPPRGPGGPVPG